MLFVLFVCLCGGLRLGTLVVIVFLCLVVNDIWCVFCLGVLLLVIGLSGLVCLLVMVLLLVLAVLACFVCCCYDLCLGCDLLVICVYLVC